LLAEVCSQLGWAGCLFFDQHLHVVEVAFAALAECTTIDVGACISDQLDLATAFFLDGLSKCEEVFPGLALGVRDQFFDGFWFGWEAQLLHDVGAVPDAGRTDVPWHGNQTAVSSGALGPLVRDHVLLILAAIEWGSLEVGQTAFGGEAADTTDFEGCDVWCTGTRCKRRQQLVV